MDLGKLIESQEVLDHETKANDRLVTIFKRLLRVVEDLRRVLHQADADRQDLHEAAEAVRGQLVEILRMEGATLFGAVGEPIDPQRHTVVEVGGAVMQPPVVLEVRCEGLEWKSRIIQKAEVVASK